MREIDTNHRYEYDPYTGTVKDCFGDNMASVDEFVAEMNMLMAEIKRLKEELSMIPGPCTAGC